MLTGIVSDKVFQEKIVPIFSHEADKTLRPGGSVYIPGTAVISKKNKKHTHILSIFFKEIG